MNEPVSFLYPWPLDNHYLVVAFRGGVAFDGELVIRQNHGRPLFSAQLTSTSVDPVKYASWGTFALPMKPESGGVIAFEPGAFEVTYRTITNDSPMGTIQFRYNALPPLSEPQIRAIESNPHSKGVITLALRDEQSGFELRVCTASTRDQATSEIDSGAVWYQDLPDSVQPNDDEPPVPLRYLRESMHGLLLMPENLLPTGRIVGSSLWSPERIRAVLATFRALLESGSDEESVQQFIAQNPVLLSYFGATAIFLKPRILTTFVADFGILNARNELILVEIERPGMDLFRADGAPRADLVTAFNQVNSWLQECDRHRAAVLAGIRGCPPDVALIRVAVIAGRSRQSEVDFVARWRATLGDRVDFQTYDELWRATADVMAHVHLT